MRCTLSRLFARFGFGKPAPCLKVLDTLNQAAEQEAPVQLEVPQGQGRSFHQYLAITGCSPEGLALSAREPFFMVASSWQDRRCLFRFLVQPTPEAVPLLHKFQGRIVSVGRDRRTITVALPREITAMEQRRNVRLAPRREHLPNLVVWGVRKSRPEQDGPHLHHAVLLDLNAADLEMRKTLLNLSASGMRLSLHHKVAVLAREWLEPGRRLIVQMVFAERDFPGFAKHMFVSKVCNVRTADNRHELGIQFLAARVSDPAPRWLPLDAAGCERMARVLHMLQLRYYAELKHRLAQREGRVSAGAVAPAAARRAGQPTH